LWTYGSSLPYESTVKTYSSAVNGYFSPPITNTISGSSAKFEQSSFTSMESSNLSRGFDGPVSNEVPVSATTLQP